MKFTIYTCQIGMFLIRTAFTCVHVCRVTNRSRKLQCSGGNSPCVFLACYNSEFFIEHVSAAMSTVKERYPGEVIGCDIGDIKLQIHLPCDDDEELDEFPDNQPLLLNCDGGPSNGAPSYGHVTVQSGRNRRILTRRQMSTPTNMSSPGISNSAVPFTLRPPPIIRRQTLPSKLSPSITEKPGEIALKETTYDISDNSPTQINISWTPPSNANEIPYLVYEIQLLTETDSDWIYLSERGIPVLRVYTTETMFILDGERRNFSEGQCTWRLRIRGVSKDQDLRLEGPWSKPITLNICNSLSAVLDGGTA